MHDLSSGRRMKMGVLSWIVVGGLAGLIAGKITGKGHGFIGNIIIGIIGANIGGYVASRFDLGQVDRPFRSQLTGQGGQEHETITAGEM